MVIFFTLTQIAFCFVVFFFQNGLVSCSAAKEVWGYSDVRADAHMFWWLYYADNSNANPEAYQSYPLVIWLQGGPGSSSTGFGNFMEIGPQDINLKSRNTTWLKFANLLFIDNPVGTGFSYVSSPKAFAKNNSQIAIDLVALLKDVFKKLPDLQMMPLFIFSESYGGKMTVTFAIELFNAIKKGEILCDFRGIALGDSWISPYDSVASWGQYLYTMSLIDEKQKSEVDKYADKIAVALNQKQFAKATDLWSETEGFVEDITDNVNWYNILKTYDDNSDSAIIASDIYYQMYYSDLAFVDKSTNRQVIRYVGPFHQEQLSQLMNGPIRNRLQVIPANVTWGGQASRVFQELRADFMLPVIEDVDYLLNNTNLQIVVYSGQLDLIVDTVGTLNWMKKLKWSGINTFLNADRTPLVDSQQNAVAFLKSYKNLSLFWILKAGHMVPMDAGDTSLIMLQRVIKSAKSKYTLL